MCNLELLAISPSRFTFDAEPFINLHMPPLSDVSKSLWQACGRTLSVVRSGTRMAVASPFFNCPLCSASSKQGHEMTVKTIVVSQGAPHRVCEFSCVSRQTKPNEQPNALLSPSLGSCTKTAFSNSWRRSFCSSSVSWISSPANVVRTRCKTIALSSLAR